jgi:transposase/IS5 family transposase
LLPPSLDDWLPANHLARFVAETVSQLDLAALKEAYAGRGSSAYHPEMLLSLLVYGYATGVFSSRKLERNTYDSVAFRYLAVNTHPDHDTIANFRKRFLPELESLFVQVLLLAQGMKLLKLGKVSLDGTKVHANASKQHALSWGHANKIEKQLRAEVKRLLQLAEEADAADIPDGMSLPDELSRREDRLAAIAKAKAEIKQRAAERDQQAQKEHEQKVADRRKHEEESGQKAKGPEPQPPKPKGPQAKDQVNLTDAESRIMPVSGGGFEQAFNAQAGVDMKTMLIVTQHVTQAANDKEQIKPALAQLAALPKDLGKPKALVADSGYFSQDNVELCTSNRITPYIANRRQQHHPSLKSRFSGPPPLSAHADAVEKMKWRLQTPAGRKLYARRKTTVEPVFGIIKAAMGFRQFLLRGLQAAGGEWTLVCMAWNIKRLHVLAA